MPTLSHLLNFLTLSSLALIAVLGPVTEALSLDSPHVHLARHHDVALKKRDSSSQRRCKSRYSSPATQVHNSTSVQDSKTAPSPPKPSPPTPSPPTPSPSASHSTTSTVNSNAVNNGGTLPKIGIAYDSGDYSPLQYFKNSKVGPFYNWSPYCPPEVKTMGYTCCPMLWGSKQISNFQNLVKPGYAHCALGMNEPNEPSQSNMSPGAAVSMWKEYLDPLADEGYTLMSPACTNGPSGIAWYKSFFAGCTGCRIHALATHYYGTSATDMINYLIELHDTFNMLIWVTEFACQDFSYRTTCPNAYEFLGTVKKFMDNTEWIGAYFAFGVLDNMYNVNPVNQLLGSNGQPTSLGWEYIN